LSRREGQARGKDRGALLRKLAVCDPSWRWEVYRIKLVTRHGVDRARVNGSGNDGWGVRVFDKIKLYWGERSERRDSGTLVGTVVGAGRRNVGWAELLAVLQGGAPGWGR